LKKDPKPLAITPALQDSNTPRLIKIKNIQGCSYKPAKWEPWERLSAAISSAGRESITGRASDIAKTSPTAQKIKQFTKTGSYRGLS
jgi:hypothetical protein